MTTTSTSNPGRTWRRADLGLRALLALFFVGASALPKLVGEPYAVQIFAEIGAGDWFRYAIGLVELAGGIGLLVPRLIRPAAVGLIGLMVGAAVTQVLVLDQPAFVVTPVVLGVLLGLVVRYRASVASDAAPPGPS
ncbi:MAG: DoxX family protein [Pseudonocardia sp.]